MTIVALVVSLGVHPYRVVEAVEVAEAAETAEGHTAVHLLDTTAAAAAVLVVVAALAKSRLLR